VSPNTRLGASTRNSRAALSRLLLLERELGLGKQDMRHLPV